MKYLFIIVSLIISNTILAETLWKFGIGIGNITANSYPGSDEAESITSPIPYLKVKTEWFDLDREGLHTNWFKETKFRLDFSFDLGLPVKSDENQIRNGMPDLEPVGLLGPLLIYQLHDTKKIKWQIQLPLTYAYRFDDIEAHSIGWTVNPRIYFNYLIENSGYPVDISASFGPVYGSEDFHQYYYDVAADYTNSNRSIYSAEEGDGGYRLNVSITQRMNGYWLGLYLRYQDISNAVFVDSPLVKEEDYWFVAVGASWLFAGNL